MKVFVIFVLFVGLVFPVSAEPITAPPVTGEAATLMPQEMPDFTGGKWTRAKSNFAL